MVDINNLTMGQAIIIAAGVLSASIVSSLIHLVATKGKQPVHSTLWAVHIAAWIASAGLNALFWIGFVKSPMMAIIMLLISISMDIAKIIIPRLNNKNILHYAGYAMFVGMSLFATMGIGQQLILQNNIDQALDQTTQQRIAAQNNAAQFKVDSGYISPNTAASIEALDKQIEGLKNRWAVNSNGDIAFINGKKATVWQATKGCESGNAFAKLAKNQCETIKNLAGQRRTRAGHERDTADNLQNLSETLKNSEESLKEMTATLPITEMIKDALLIAGVEPNKASSLTLQATVFGVILAICLDLIIIATVANGRKKPSLIRTTLLSFLSPNRHQNPKKQPDTLGTRAGHEPDTQEIQQISFTDQLKAINADQIEEIINFNLPQISFVVTDTHKEIVVFILKYAGQDLAIGKISSMSREQFGKGFSKTHISQANEILYYNGLKLATGTASKTQYKWYVEDLMPVKYNAVKNGKIIESYEPKATQQPVKKPDNVVNLDLFQSAA